MDYLRELFYFRYQDFLIRSESVSSFSNDFSRGNFLCIVCGFKYVSDILWTRWSVIELRYADRKIDCAISNSRFSSHNTEIATRV